MVSGVILSALRKMWKYALSMVIRSPMAMLSTQRIAMINAACKEPLLIRSNLLAPRFCAVKLVIAVPNALSGVIVSMWSRFAAPKPVCAALETIRPASMSNWTMTLCIVMMPIESTENWSPSGTPCTMCCVTSFFVMAKSGLCSRSSGYLENA